MLESGAIVDTTMATDEMRAAAEARPVARPPDVHEVVPLSVDGVTGRLYRPLGASEAPPLVLFFHGGGWVLPYTSAHDATARHIANKSGCAVFAVDYRLAPEHVFPAAYDDCWAATRWAAEHLDDLECRQGPLGLLGDSAGGGLAAAVALRARASDMQLGALTLVYPALDLHPERHRSYEEHAEAPVLSAKTISWFVETYRAGAAYDDWRLAPYNATSLAGLPPTMIVGAEVDPLVSEGEKFAKRLGREGVPVEHHVIPGTFHGFFGFVDQLEEAREAQWIVADFLRRSLR